MSTLRFMVLSVAFLAGNYASLWLGIIKSQGDADQRTFAQVVALLFAYVCLRQRKPNP